MFFLWSIEFLSSERNKMITTRWNTKCKEVAFQSLKKSCPPPQSDTYGFFPCCPPPSLTRSSSGPVLHLFWWCTLSTRGMGHPTSGNGGTNLFQSKGGACEVTTRSFKRHTLARCLENAGTQAVFSWVFTGSFRPDPKKPLVHRDEGEDSIFAVSLGALAMYFREDFLNFDRISLHVKKEHSLPDGWGEHRMDEKFQWCARRLAVVWLFTETRLCAYSVFKYHAERALICCEGRGHGRGRVREEGAEQWRELNFTICCSAGDSQKWLCISSYTLFGHLSMHRILI